MSSDERRAFLLAGRWQARRLMEQLPEDSLSRIGLEMRLEEIEEDLAALQAQQIINNAKLCATFEGDAVFGIEGIDADFFAAAVSKTQKLIQEVHIQKSCTEPRTPERVSKKTLTAQARMAFTNVVRGSFGFELREMSHQTSMVNTDLEAVVDESAELLHKLSEGWELVDLYEDGELEQGVVDSLAGLLKLLADNNVSIKLESNTRRYQISAEKIKRTFESIDGLRVDRQRRSFRGILRGWVVRGTRRFDFIHWRDNSLVSGSITGTVPTEVLDIWGAQFMGKQCWIVVEEVTTTRRDNSKAKLVLQSIHPDSPFEPELETAD